MNSRARWTHATLLTIALCCLANTAQADSGDATDAAFGALLSMPGAQPRENGWLIPEQFARAPKNDKALIARLRELQRKGADFNAQRHRGSLLAHTIRAGKEGVAIWLLENGADPKQVHPESTTTAYDLARTYKRTAIIRVLEERYGFKPPVAPLPQPTASASSAAPTSPATPLTRIEQGHALLVQLLRTPYPDKGSQAQWQAFAAKLSDEEFRTLFKDAVPLTQLVQIVRDTEGGLENALARLPRETVRQHAQLIADTLADWSFVEYGDNPKIRYTTAARSWSALWRRIERPLDYSKQPALAGHLPPTQWPALFASGYTRHEAAVTGCLLSAMDADAFKALWPSFQQYFPDARQEAPALVLGRYRFARTHLPCYYSSTAAETVAKLAFLRTQGVTSPVTGLRPSALADASNPALLEAAAMLTPPMDAKPRLVVAPLGCNVVLSDLWLNALIRIRGVGEVPTPAEYVQAIEIPGQQVCGLVISGDSYGEYPSITDDFSEGPFRPGSINCADAPHDSEIWVEAKDKVPQKLATGESMRGNDALYRFVRDTQTGKRYALNSGRGGPVCSEFWTLPTAYEWQSSKQGPALVASQDSELVDSLLRRQCEETDAHAPLRCHGIDAEASSADIEGQDTLITLRTGRRVYLEKLIDMIGAERQREYLASIFALDRVRQRALLAAGIPARWTVEAVRKISESTLPLQDKRRRIALVFADAAQLDRALGGIGRDHLTEALITWLPREDWGPILRTLRRNPELWNETANRLRTAAEESNRSALACDIDRAQGFLCGGGFGDVSQ
ncbi:MAG: hypothetical protein QM776_09070 [Rhodocyclaceae bacterium]